MNKDKQLLEDFAIALFDSGFIQTMGNSTETQKQLKEFVSDWLNDLHSEECDDKRYREDIQFNYYEEELN